VATGTGWTYRVIDEMTIPEVCALLDYWRTSPPVHLLVAGLVGYKPSAARALPAADYDPAAEQFINRVSAADFDNVLRSYGLPTSQDKLQ
jgi:hypothetical protein